MSKAKPRVKQVLQSSTDYSLWLIFLHSFLRGLRILKTQIKPQQIQKFFVIKSGNFKKIKVICVEKKIRYIKFTLFSMYKPHLFMEPRLAKRFWRSKLFYHLRGFTTNSFKKHLFFEKTRKKHDIQPENTYILL